MLKMLTTLKRNYSKQTRKPARNQRATSAILTLTLATSMLGGWITGAIASVDAKIHGVPQPLMDFKLQQASGDPFTLQNLKGKWSLILLGYTHCPDVCPFTLQNLAQVDEQLSLRVSPARKPQIVFIGVDPDRDHKIIGQYVKHFGDTIIGATGDWSEVSKAVETLGGFVRFEGRDKDPEGYRVFHSAAIAIIDPQSRLVGAVNPPMAPAETATFLAELIAKHARAAQSKN
ncbi:MAG: SCO family protein [Filomicrobium sp.]